MDRQDMAHPSRHMVALSPSPSEYSGLVTKGRHNAAHTFDSHLLVGPKRIALLEERVADSALPRVQIEEEPSIISPQRSWKQGPARNPGGGRDRTRS
jgi:hypothetical protein